MSVRFNLRFVLSSLAFFSLILAIPIVGESLFYGSVAISMFLGLMIVVQFPVFILIRRWLNYSDSRLNENKAEE